MKLGDIIDRTRINCNTKTLSVGLQTRKREGNFVFCVELCEVHHNV